MIFFMYNHNKFIFNSTFWLLRQVFYHVGFNKAPPSRPIDMPSSPIQPLEIDLGDIEENKDVEDNVDVIMANLIYNQIGFVYKVENYFKSKIPNPFQLKFLKDGSICL